MPEISAKVILQLVTQRLHVYVRPFMFDSKFRFGSCKLTKPLMDESRISFVQNTRPSRYKIAIISDSIAEQFTLLYYLSVVVDFNSEYSQRL